MPTTKKSGWYSSEFFIACLVIIVATVTLITNDITAEDWKWAVSAATAGYSVSRGLAKVKS